MTSRPQVQNAMVGWWLWASGQVGGFMRSVDPAEPDVPRPVSSLTKRGKHHDRKPAPGRIAPDGAELSQGRLPPGSSRGRARGTRPLRSQSTELPPAPAIRARGAVLGTRFPRS
jgi:hypothetical protein